MPDIHPLLSAMPEMAGVLDILSEPAAILSLDYRILATNRAYQREYPDSHTHPGRRCYEVSHGYSEPCDQVGEACPLRQCAQSGERQRVLHIHNTPHGQEHVDVEMTPIYDQRGALLCYLEVMHLVKAAKPTSDGEGMVGRSQAFNRMLALLQRAAPSEIGVLLLGESGTGKELVARALHDQSRRCSGPFVTVECSGLNEGLFESELFGHERGAFTGAVHRKQGLVSAARGGTLFLDEIGDVPLSLQVKLLRLIETGSYRSVGGVELQHADFRLVCATHRNLMQMVEQGLFRRDLYYRISAFPVELPSLRERREDIPLLVQTLLKRIPGGDLVQVTPQAMQSLTAYSYPGNIRELRNLLERAVLLADNGAIGPNQLPDAVTAMPAAQTSPSRLQSLEEIELNYLLDLQERFCGDNRALAEALGISERTLYRKLHRARAAQCQE